MRIQMGMAMALAVGLGATAYSSVEQTVELTPGSTHAFAPSVVPPVLTEREAIRSAERLVLANRLLDARCVLRRDGAVVETVGACTETFAASHEIAGWQDDGRGIALLDAAGETLVSFSWNEETGLSSTSSAAMPEAGALTLVPVDR